MSGEGGCQYLEWIVDGPDILRLANNRYRRIKTGRWQVPFPRRTHHLAKLMIIQDSSFWFM